MNALTMIHIPTAWTLAALHPADELQKNRRLESKIAIHFLIPQHVFFIIDCKITLFSANNQIFRALFCGAMHFYTKMIRKPFPCTNLCLGDAICRPSSFTFQPFSQVYNLYSLVIIARMASASDNQFWISIFYLQ